jgi:hypothetical protein
MCPAIINHLFSKYRTCHILAKDLCRVEHDREKIRVEKVNCRMIAGKMGTLTDIGHAPTIL